MYSVWRGVPHQFKNKSNRETSQRIGVQRALLCSLHHVVGCCPPTALRRRLQMVGGRALRPAAGLRPMSEWHHRQCTLELSPRFCRLIGRLSGRDKGQRSALCAASERAQSSTEHHSSQFWRWLFSQQARDNHSLSEDGYSNYTTRISRASRLVVDSEVCAVKTA
jgi:hypothetical protein